MRTNKYIFNENFFFADAFGYIITENFNDEVSHYVYSFGNEIVI
jgi:hypothetical protein